MGVDRRGGSCPTPWIFINGTDIVDRGLIVLFFGIFFLLFFGLFSVSSLLPRKRLNSAILRPFLHCSPLEIFLPIPLFAIVTLLLFDSNKTRLALETHSIGKFVTVSGSKSVWVWGAAPSSCRRLKGFGRCGNFYSVFFFKKIRNFRYILV